MPRNPSCGPRGGEVTTDIAQALQKAAGALARGDWPESERWCRQVLAASPDHADALTVLGVVAAQTGRSEEAARLLGRVAAAYPGEATAHNNYANVLKGLKRLDEALESYDRALAIKGDYADALSNRGSVLRELKRFEQALASCDQALALSPGHVGALNNRGNTLRELQRFEEALAAYNQALAIRPRFAEALNNRGIALKELRRLEEALACYDQALAVRPDYAEAFFNRGNALHELNRFEEALAAYRRALAANPRYFMVYARLGSLLCQLGRTDQASGIYRQWLELEPTNPVARHLYAATSRDEVPQRASAQYVTMTFDEFADSFDTTLERLRYAAPQLLHEAVLERVREGDRGGLAVLDAGCGTGLCGVLLRSLANTLVGVDLSSQMLARARARHLYDELHEGELCAFMASRPGHFDLVTCADTLIYFGALEEALAAGHRCLRAHGLFAFTVEALPEGATTTFRINVNGRYAHAEGYLRETMQSQAFCDVQCRSVVLRKEFGNDVKGYLVIGSV